MDEFTAWLNSVCFQKPTPEAYDLAKDAWKAALKSNKEPVAKLQLQRWVICRLFKKHKYYTIKKYSKTIRKVGCRRCEKVWGMNDRVKTLLEWDGELEELHEGR